MLSFRLWNSDKKRSMKIQMIGSQLHAPHICRYTTLQKISYAKNQIIMCKACQAFLTNAIYSAVFKSHCINLHTHSMYLQLQGTKIPPKTVKGEMRRKGKWPSNHLMHFNTNSYSDHHKVVPPRC